MQIVSRIAALDSGLKRYFTGLPCKRGHVVERYTVQGGCVKCALDGVVRYIARNRDKHRAWNAKASGVYRAGHKPVVRRLKCGYMRKRKKQLKAQRCSCCTLIEIKAFLATKPQGRETDHILAIGLGGAHCLKNLQFLTLAAHKAKSAEDMRLIAQAKRETLANDPKSGA